VGRSGGDRFAAACMRPGSSCAWKQERLHVLYRPGHRRRAIVLQSVGLRITGPATPGDGRAVLLVRGSCSSGPIGLARPARHFGGARQSLVVPLDPDSTGCLVPRASAATPAARRVIPRQPTPCGNLGSSPELQRPDSLHVPPGLHHSAPGGETQNLGFEGHLWEHLDSAPGGRSEDSSPATTPPSRESYLPAVPFARGSFHAPKIYVPAPPVKRRSRARGAFSRAFPELPGGDPHRVRAPSDADPTCAAYFARTPEV
jgi:hypothetical protein